ncbi:NAD(P)H-dependent oxidoreductase [Acinetobacter lactucae]|uniref:NAD(P)H-dependent oxidoreductase n=1 Tax=Acinetobacter lactucae TaxID=1785128 RepID=UPI0015F4CBD4|nr:NAD(P)H-dependent oxidoreductase [Acinetobacter lactucae]MDV7473223.1 NAD(P)H-dependent oxidoreductase [Acinetobacter baumannii]
MSNTLVVVAHPDLSKSRINAAWIEAISGLPNVKVHQLYKEYPDFKVDVKLEQKLVEQSESIVLQFPFQWYNCPALLKQWLDDVLENGWAYGEGGHALEGKTLSIAVSTWSREKDYQVDGRYNRSMEELTSPFEVTAMRVGMHYRPGFFLNGIGDLTEDGLNDNLEKYRDFILSF